MAKDEIAVQVIGDLSVLAPDIRELVARCNAEAQKRPEFSVATLCINYGGRDEIKNAVRAIAQEVQAGQLKPEDITEDTISQHLYTAHMPDPDFIIRKLKEVVNPGMTLILNNEEPRSRFFEEIARRSIYYGVSRHDESFTKGVDYPTQACPKCHHDMSFDYYNVDSIGAFHCDFCGFVSKKTPDYQVTDLNFADQTFRLKNVVFHMPYDLPFMFYNYAGALAVCEAICGIVPEAAAKAFENFKNIGGRFEILTYKNKTIKYMRIKQENPDTLQSALNIMASDQTEKMVALGLYVVSDFIPHYINTFYAFDCDFKPVVESNVERYLCFSEHVSYDTANRLIYDGVAKDAITIMDSDDINEIFAEIDKAETDNIYLITWLSTFEKMKRFIEGGQN